LLWGNRWRNLPSCSVSSLITTSLFPPPEVAATISLKNGKGMKTIMINKYTTAHIAPIVSGSSFLLTLPISFPFIPAFMNVGPSHRIIAYEDENAMPLRAREAMRGSPSPWKVFAIMPRHASDIVARVQLSVEESTADAIAKGLSPCNDCGC
jgi:hypothetical protein